MRKKEFLVRRLHLGRSQRNTLNTLKNQIETMVIETIIIENEVNLGVDHLVGVEANPNPKKSLGGKTLGVKNRYKHLFVE